MAGINGEPDKRYELDLWEVNHSRDRLILEERSDHVAYKLGYQMQPQAFDPDAVAYKNFSEDQFPDGNISEMDYVEGKKVALTMDFNRNPQTAALCQRMGDKYIVFDEVVTDNALTQEQGINVAKRIENWGITHVYLYGDNTSNQKAGKYGRTGKNDWQYVKEALQDRGITFTSKLRKQNPKRKVRVDKVNTVIYNEITKERRLVIHSRCEKAIKDYRESVTDDDGLKIDNGKIGHISDAIDYWVYECESGNKGLTYIL